MRRVEHLRLLAARVCWFEASSGDDIRERISAPGTEAARGRLRERAQAILHSALQG